MTDSNKQTHNLVTELKNQGVPRVGVTTKLGEVVLRDETPRLGDKIGYVQTDNVGNPVTHGTALVSGAEETSKKVWHVTFSEDGKGGTQAIKSLNDKHAEQSLPDANAKNDDKAAQSKPTPAAVTSAPDATSSTSTTVDGSNKSSGK